jgi:hypothetical protein
MKPTWTLPLLLLTGCASAPEPAKIVITAPPVVEKKLLRDVVPTSLLACQIEPDGFSTKTIRQSAEYILDVKKAGRDCRQKLGSVRKIIQSEQ